MIRLNSIATSRAFPADIGSYVGKAWKVAIGLRWYRTPVDYNQNTFGGWESLIFIILGQKNMFLKYSERYQL